MSADKLKDERHRGTMMVAAVVKAATNLVTLGEVQPAFQLKIFLVEHELRYKTKVPVGAKGLVEQRELEPGLETLGVIGEEGFHVWPWNLGDVRRVTYMCSTSYCIKTDTESAGFESCSAKAAMQGLARGRNLHRLLCQCRINSWLASIEQFSRFSL